MPRKLELVRALSLALLTVLLLIDPAGAATRGARRIHTQMINSGVAPSARGKVVVVSSQSQSAFTIKVDRMSPGVTYDIVVNGTVRDRMTMNASGHGQVTHRARVRATRTSTLPYDPRGAQVQIASSGRVVLSADVPQTPDDSETQTEIKLDLTAATGVTGSASAEFRELGGRMKFDVDVEGAAPGTYDLVVAGANVGQITVDVDGSGEIRFDSSPSTSVCGDDGENDDDSSDPSMDLLLTFDPRGQSIEIQLAGVAVFSGTLPTVPPPPDAGDDDGDGQGGD